ncbi:phosphoribosyltransferase family protein [Saccharomonospora sp. NPDC046836]|uniref:phosphoribosyltransferase n=1 Tax=Saccharomonospora sp. NPDC046836 TaxID=3156921 RepID=UPI0033F2BD5F
MEFENRRAAGRELAQRLGNLRAYQPLVLGLPRGGVIVAKEIADALDAPLDVLLVRKMGAPGRPELAIGAVGEGGVLVTNDDLVQQLRLSSADIDAAANRERVRLDQLGTQLRQGTPALAVAGRTVVLADDGIATGATVRAALQVLRARGASRIVLAVPVAPADVLEELSRETDRTVCPNPRVWMRAVGNWYRDFAEVSDAEVIALLHDQRRPQQVTGTQPEG